MSHRSTVHRSRAQHETDTPARAFIAEAHHNLTLLRRLYGTGGERYRRLLRHYRAVADALECRTALERSLHALRRHSDGRREHPWRSHRPG